MEKVDRLLYKIGINQNLKGYNYIKEIIIDRIKEDKFLSEIGYYYQKFADKNNSSYIQVEKNIRYAIESSNYKLLGYDEKPHNTTFINKCIFIIKQSGSKKTIRELKQSMNILSSLFEVELRFLNNYKKDKKYNTWTEFAEDKSIDDLELINNESIEIDNYKVNVWVKDNG